jgi:hypothetical protein
MLYHITISLVFSRLLRQGWPFSIRIPPLQYAFHQRIRSKVQKEPRASDVVTKVGPKKGRTVPQSMNGHSTLDCNQDVHISIGICMYVCKCKCKMQLHVHK